MSASRPVTITALGIAQILGWGTSFYFPAVLAGPIVADTGWSLFWVVSGTSIGLLVAGLISPRVGAFIDRRGGRPVLALSSLLYAAGLGRHRARAELCRSICSAGSCSAAAWAPGSTTRCSPRSASSTARRRARPITNLTLFGGFASTVCWPLSALLAESFGWRGACLIYAALHLVIALPLQMAVMPPLQRCTARCGDSDAKRKGRGPDARASAPEFVLLALILTISSGIGSIVIVHFMIFLQARGAELALAVTFGTLFGPAQVGARVVERLFGRHYHPIWTMVASCALMAAGLALLLAGFPLLALVDRDLWRRLRHHVDRARHAAARAVRRRPLRHADRAARVSGADRAGAGAVGRRAADRAARRRTRPW